MISVIGGLPMGIGIFAVWPLARRFGKRNVTLAGFILYAAGGMICWMHPTNMTIMLIGQLIKISADFLALMYLWHCLQMFWIIWNGRRDFEVMDWRCLSTTLLQ